MKMLTLNEMKTLKTFHLIFIMMWTVGVMIMGMLYWSPSESSLEFLYNQQTALMIDYIFVIPGAILTVITGAIYGFKTKWGFFKYKWLKVKWIIGVAIILIGTFVLHPLALDIIDQSRQSANESICFPSDYFGAKHGIVNIAALLQALGLLFLVGVSVFKPWNKKIRKN